MSSKKNHKNPPANSCYSKTGDTPNTLKSIKTGLLLLILHEGALILWWGGRINSQARQSNIKVGFRQNTYYTFRHSSTPSLPFGVNGLLIQEGREAVKSALTIWKRCLSFIIQTCLKESANIPCVVCDCFFKSCTSERTYATPGKPHALHSPWGCQIPQKYGACWVLGSCENLPLSCTEQQSKEPDSQYRT